MHKFTASFLGRDCPGVVASVTAIMEKAQCDIIEVSQTILAGEFAAIFVVGTPDGLDAAALEATLQQGLAAANVDLSVIVRPSAEGVWADTTPCAPFVVTAHGPDKPGLIAGMSRVFARHGVNIENLKAILGEGGDNQALFVFEVKVPDSVDTGRLRRELVAEGMRLELLVSVQHRDIFEAVHRIQPI
ncbi:MAG: glycine cleavage system protein R [Desulfovibrionaceae bacterium]|nr:ACT domain-containing protein [Desulfovibrionaceae bacterium]